MDIKKNPLQCVQEVLNQIHPDNGGTFTLYAMNNKLCCCRKKNTPKDGIRISDVTAYQIRTGLVTQHWNDIEARIRSLIAQEKL